MSLDSVLDILRERGLQIRVSADGKPTVAGKKDEITDAVRETLAAYRDEIIERLKPTQRREFLWPNGAIALDCLHLAQDAFPFGAWYWRWLGENDWWPIPGKTWSGELTEAQTEHAKTKPTDRAAERTG